MRACGRNLEGPSRTLLPADVGEIGRRFLAHLLRQRLVRGYLDLSTEVRDDLCEMAHRNRLDARERRLRGRLGGTDDAREAGATRALGDREGPRHRSDPSVQRELADGGVLREPLRRQLSRRAEDCERDRKVEPGPLLAKRCRREIDRDSPVEWPVQRGRDDSAAHTVVFAALIGSRSYWRRSR